MSDQIAQETQKLLADAWRTRPEYQILALFPVDELGHITDCGYDANEEQCGCAALPGRIVDWLAEHDRQVRAEELPTEGCTCTPYGQDAGGGYVEHLLEYEPNCPEHSQHVWNPRTGVWELAAQSDQEDTDGEFSPDFASYMEGNKLPGDRW